MTEKNPALESIDSDALINELKSRGYALAVWSVDDADGSLEHDPACDALSDKQFASAKEIFFERASDGINEVVAQRGNSYLDDRWTELRASVIAEVLAKFPDTSPAPEEAPA